MKGNIIRRFREVKKGGFVGKKGKLEACKVFQGMLDIFYFLSTIQREGGGRTPLTDRGHVPPKKSIYYTPLLRL